MNKVLLITLSLFLNACQVQEQAIKDAELAASNGDFRLYQAPGRGGILPGIDTQMRNNAARVCGIKVIEEISDVITSEDDRKKRKQLIKYASNYNQEMYSLCLKANAADSL